MKSALLFFFILIPLWSQSQVADTLNIKSNSRTADKAVQIKKPDTVNTGKKSKIVFRSVEKSPEFPGGMEALNRYINRNIIQQKDGSGKYIRGKVIVKFTVDTLGLVKNPTIIMSAHPFLSVEAERVIKSLPKWNPGTRDGVPRNAELVLPITF